MGLLITAAELHIRADLGVVDAAEKSLGPELADSSLPAATAAHVPDPAAEPAAS